MGTFNIDDFFATLRNLKDAALEKLDKEENDKRELELVRMKYDSDRKDAYGKIESEQKSTIASLSLFSVCVVLLAAAMQCVGFFNSRLYNMMCLAIVVFLLVINMLCVMNALKKLNEFTYTNTYGKYLITDDWYLEIDDCLVDIKGEDVNLDATYILGINYGKKFEISKEQYLTLDMLDEREVIVIDLYKTHEMYDRD